MTFFERFEKATPRIINQLWQSDYLDTPERNEAMELILPPLRMKLWLERVLVVLGALFVTAGVLLFFAFNWVHIPPMLKLGGILGLIAILLIGNVYLLGKEKTFAGNLVLSVAAFMAGVFMAVFGQIYQTGADSYTLFLTWAIMILPWVIMARFAPLWVLWFVVSNVALLLWWALDLYPDMFEENHLFIIISIFYFAIYALAQFAMSKGEDWLNKKWIKLLLAIGVFAPITMYVFRLIEKYDIKYLDWSLWVAAFIFIGLYIFAKLIKKSIEEYSVGYFCTISILIFLGIRTGFEFAGDDFIELLLLFMAVFVITSLYFGYKYFRYVTRDFKESL